MIDPEMNYKDCDALLKDKTKWTQNYDEYPCCKKCNHFDWFFPTESEVLDCENPICFCMYGHPLQKKKCKFKAVLQRLKENRE